MPLLYGSAASPPRAGGRKPNQSPTRAAQPLVALLSFSPFCAQASRALSGRVRVPGDKSISHRALMLGALATGRTTIAGLLEGEDVLNTAKALAGHGLPGAQGGATRGRCWAAASAASAEPDGDIDFGNSGTGMRLMMGLVAGHDMRVRFVGDASLSRRPMGRVLKPLTQMGLEVEEPGRDRLPLAVRGTRRPAADRVCAAGRLGADQVGRAAGRAARGRRHHRGRGAGDPRPHRAHAAPLRGRGRPSPSATARAPSR